MRLSQGGKVEGFEAELVRSVGTQHAIAVANGSMAIEPTFRAADPQGGGAVLVPSSNNFSVHVAAVQAGCRVELVDVNPATLSKTQEGISAALERIGASAFALVHMGGLMTAEMSKIFAAAGKLGAVVVED